MKTFCKRKSFQKPIVSREHPRKVPSGKFSDSINLFLLVYLTKTSKSEQKKRTAKAVRFLLQAVFVAVVCFTKFSSGFFRASWIAVSPCTGFAGSVEFLLVCRTKWWEEFNMEVEIFLNITRVYWSIVHTPVSYTHLTLPTT